ncbi:hypothetical protein GCM10028812_39370 [Ancylobacter sonchi]
MRPITKRSAACGVSVSAEASGDIPAAQAVNAAADSRTVVIRIRDLPNRWSPQAPGNRIVTMRRKRRLPQGPGRNPAP